MIFPFGKYKGADIADVPTSYLKWLVCETGDDELVAAIEEELGYRRDHNVDFE